MKSPVDEMASIEGKHALVTGGGRGIGRAIAAALTAAGASVSIMGRGEKTLAEAVGAGAAAGYVIADVTDVAAVNAAVKQAAAARGPVDLLIANAGTATAVPFAKATPDQFRDMFEQHVLGMMHPAQAVLGDMIKRGFGRIVAVASIVALRASPNVSPYTTAKHAMLGLVRSIAVETAGTGVTVNAVCPGFVDTDLIRGTVEQMVKRGTSREEAMSRFTSQVPVGRLVTPQEVAEAVLYFCSPAAGAATGATLVIGADGA
ncbi:short-chain alcohol dehydrogenase [Rhodoplanes sp. Z2-YC6860]|nr:short-chain alcohol dehydrogenase [Rhodoplanes sp. Z2-YC6860]